MRIAVVGVGDYGSRLAARLTDCGHQSCLAPVPAARSRRGQTAGTGRVERRRRQDRAETGGAYLSGIDVGLWQHAAAQQGGNFLRIDLVIFGLAAVDGVHIERMSQDEGNALLSAEIGEPIP